MKQLLYVYVPGFEYDSKGPLHIDAIRLDVTVGEIEKNIDNKIVNSLPTYIYISPVDTTNGTSVKMIPGNLIYRSDTTNQSFIDNRYNGIPSESPLWTEEKTGRAVHGYFYDFITTEEKEEQTHHIIGIHNTPDACKNVSNLDLKEHDGLFIIQIEELNTDLTLNFTFYSRIDNSEVSSDTITVGTLEGITKQIVGSFKRGSKNNFFNQDECSDFFEKYIEIGKWAQTYNPAVSGVEQVELQAAETRNQYFDLETWGTDDHSWEIPINADVLVSNMSDDKYSRQVGNKLIWKQFKYDNDKNSKTYRTHICDDNLICNAKNYDSYGDFYTNFYSGYRTVFSIDSTKKNYYFDTCVFAEYFGGLYCNCQSVNYLRANFLDTRTASFEYNLSYVNLTNLNYLYRQPIYLTINNLTHDSTVANTSDLDCLVISLDHYGVNTPVKKNFDMGILDHYHFFNRGKNGKQWQYHNKQFGNFTYLSDATIKVYEKLPGVDKKEISLSSNKLSLRYEKERADSYNNKTIENYLKSYYKKRQDPKIDNGFKSSFLQTLKEKSSDSINHIEDKSLLNTGEQQIQLTNDAKLGIYINVSDVSFPFFIYDGIIGSTGLAYPTMINKFLKTVKFNGNYFFRDRGIGNVTVFLPQMFQIDLDTQKTNISKNNLADYKIIPMLFSDKNGYSRGQQIPVNVETTNLLDPSSNSPDPESNSQGDSGYELQRVLNNDSIIKTTTQLLYKNIPFGMEKTRYNSSFCNEKRFIGRTIAGTAQMGVDSLIISIEKTVQLTPGLYVFKIQNMYLKEDNGTTITYTFDKSKSEYISGYYNKWVFLVNTACTFTLHKIIRQQTSWTNSDYTCDVISGIGLYKVNLDKTDTNTLTLNDTVSKLNNSGFLSPTDYSQIYNQIIFPAAFCAQEDVHFCKRNGSYRNPLYKLFYKPDYENDYCLNIDNDPVYHYYNFKYLPSRAVYDVCAYYTIPTGNESKIDVEKVQVVLEDQFNKEKLAFLGSYIVRV